MPEHPPPIPADEAARLAALQQLLVLDTAPEPLFEAITRQASALCGTPIAMVNLVDAERQWFMASTGITGLTETPRDIAFCAHTIAGDALLEVCDATQDRRFAHNPLVTGNLHLRYYAGVPLVLDAGAHVGTLCVVDHQPRQLTAAQRTGLQALAELATLALTMRRNLLHQSLQVRGQYEAGLAAAESHYRSLVEDQSELVSLAHPDGVLVYTNRAYAAHFGHQPAELVGISLYDFVAPHDRDAVRATLGSLVVDGPAASGENRMVDTHGLERWVAWTNRLRHDARRGPLLHSVGRDITDRKQAEAALRASQALLERSGRIAGVGGWELELASGHLTWSDQTRRIHEVDADFVPTLDKAIGFYTDAVRPLITAAVQRGLDSGQPWDLVLSMVTARGRPIRVRAVGEVEYANGLPVRLVGAFQDVTERHQLEERVAGSERFLRQLADSLPLRIAYLDRERRYRFVNQAWQQQFGCSQADAIGRTRAELRPGDDDAPMARRAQAALAGQSLQFEYAERGAQGEPLRIENRLVPDLDAGGQVRGFFVTGIDITQRSAAEAALRRLTAIIDHTSDFIVQTDGRGAIVYLNPSARQALGLAADAPLPRRHVAAFCGPETRRALARQILPAVRASGSWVGESSVLLAGGRSVPVSHMLLAHRAADGRIERYSAILRDITGQAEARQEIARQTETLRLVAEAIPSTVAAVDAAGRYRFANSAFERWAGLSRAQIVGRPTAEVLGAEEYARRLPWIQRAQAGQPVSFQTERSMAGGLHVQEMTYVPLTLADGRPDGFVAVGQDITRQKQEELRLRDMALRDPLSGLLNRAGFEEALEAWQPLSGPLALLYIDLDHFKPVNDTHGHPVGDAVLRQFGQRLGRLVRPSDVVARLGGDEFAIAVRGFPDKAMAQALADKVLAAAALPFELEALRVAIGASVGVAFDDLQRVGWRALVARADAQLLAAKSAGRGRQWAETR